jgi:hypothetical protein
MQLLDTREKLATVCRVVKQIAFGQKQCYDYDCNVRGLLASGGAEKLLQGSITYKLGDVFSNCYILRKEGYEDLQVADWSGCRLGIGSVEVGCATQKGYRAWRALLRELCARITDAQALLQMLTHVSSCNSA